MAKKEIKKTLNFLPVRKCDRCGKKFKQKNIKFLGESRPIYVHGCDCQRENEEKLKIIEGQRARKQKIERLKDCGYGPRFKDCILVNFKINRDHKAHNQAIEYIAKFERYISEGRGLILTGKVGCGKTHLLVAVIKEIADRYYSRIHAMQFRTLVDLLGELKLAMKDDKSEQVARSFMYTDVLIIDDLGAERLTDWSKEILYRIINFRYEQMKPILISTNLNVDELIERFDERIISRLFEMCIGIIMVGEDYRRE